MAPNERLPPPAEANGALASFVNDIIDRDLQDDPVIPTGLTELDGLLAGGLRRGQLSVVAGLPGAGSLTLGLTIASNAAIRHSKATFVVTPFVEQRDVLARIVSAETKIAISHFRSGALTADDRMKASRKREQLSEALITVKAGHEAAMTPLELGTSIEAMAADGLRLAVVDVRAFAESAVPDLVQILKSVAQRLGVSVVLLGRIRVPFGRVHEPPMLEDLRDYADVLDLLDLVVLIHRDDMHHENSARPGEADLDIAKHRYGPTRRMTVLFQGHWARFVDSATLFRAMP